MHRSASRRLVIDVRPRKYQRHRGRSRKNSRGSTDRLGQDARPPTPSLPPCQRCPGQEQSASLYRSSTRRRPSLPICPSRSTMCTPSANRRPVPQQETPSPAQAEFVAHVYENADSRSHAAASAAGGPVTVATSVAVAAAVADPTRCGDGKSYLERDAAWLPARVP